MIEPKKHSAKYLWRVGSFLVLSLVIGTPFLLVVLLKWVKLYELDLGFDENQHVGISICIVIVLVVTVWIWVSNAWRKWALDSVLEAEKYFLEMRINDRKESFLIKKWSELSPRLKAFRFGGFLIVLAVCLYGDYYRGEENRRYDTEGILTEARVLSIKKKYKRKKLNLVAEYRYQIEGVVYIDEKIIKSGWFIKPLEQNGFPIHPGDQFQVEYQKSSPTKNRLNVDLPLGPTLKRFKALSRESLLKEGLEPVYCDCLIKRVYAEYGLVGLAKLYNRNASYFDNERYNEINYALMTEKEAYKAIVKDCEKKPSGK